MNFKQIESFLWASRLGSFSAAARRLNTTQPAISMRISELEKGLGVKLFDRQARSLRLTPDGREFTDYARRISDLAMEAETRLGDRSQVTGRLKLGVTESVALTWLSSLVVHLNEEFPAMLIDLDVNLTNVVWTKLRGGDLDLAVLPGPAYGADLATTYLGSILYTWMASPKMGLGGPGRRLGPKDLESVPVITLSEDSNLHDIIDTWFGKSSAAPRRVDVCNSLGVVAELTMAGLGISMLPPSIFAEEICSGRLYELKTGPRITPLDFWAVQPRRGQTPVTDTIARFASEASTFEFTNPPSGA
ncbi:MAG: LysR family transcriptional regulator [Paracoccaceae bacterium]|nr:LysR family transcriptional regulator [Paracoccaceae bacterium]